MYLWLAISDVGEPPTVVGLVERRKKAKSFTVSSPKQLFKFFRIDEPANYRPAIVRMTASHARVPAPVPSESRSE